MGFFSSRRPEETEQPLQNDNTVVQVIRSRFYGKHKSKGREVLPSPEVLSLRSSVAPSSDPPRDDHSLQDSGSLRIAERRSQPPPQSSLVPVFSRSRPPNLTIATDTYRTPTDAITITLAQRLNELAAANAQGLLDDDEYRLLRQNLFERLAGGSAVPSEASLVPVAGPSKDHADARRSMSHQRRPSSNFHVQTSRPPSVQSKRSFTSTVSGILKRTSSKRHTIASDTRSDAGSVFSSPRTPDRSAFSPSLSKSSGISLGTERSSVLRDSDSIASRSLKLERTPVSQTFHFDSKSRSSGRSVRRAPSLPPSSFPPLSLRDETRIAQMSVIDTLEDDEELQTTQEIREAIERLEAEGRRLLDAFNGLELSTLVRQHRRPGASPLSAAAMLNSPVDSNSHWKSTLSPPASIRAGGDNDAMSTRSGGSVHTAISRKRSPSVSSRLRQVQPSAAPVCQPVTLGRKGSMSSMASRSRSGTTASQNAGRFGFGSTSSLNLRGSSNHLPLEPVSETEASQPTAARPIDGHALLSSAGLQSLTAAHEDDNILALEAEMAEIRRRRAEVTARYEARIEYLRARLKGAELREKLLKR